MVIKPLMMQDLSFLGIGARAGNSRVDFDIFPPTKVLPSGFCRPSESHFLD